MKHTAVKKRHSYSHLNNTKHLWITFFLNTLNHIYRLRKQLHRYRRSATTAVQMHFHDNDYNILPCQLPKSPCKIVCLLTLLWLAPLLFFIRPGSLVLKPTLAPTIASFHSHLLLWRLLLISTLHLRMMNTSTTYQFLNHHCTGRPVVLHWYLALHFSFEPDEGLP